MSSKPEFTPGGLPLRVYNEEVLYADAPLSTLGRDDIEWLKTKALKTARQRIRICSHRDSGDLLHEMLIVHARDTYVRPHKHVNKDESFHVIAGEVDVVLFEENGALCKAIPHGRLHDRQTVLLPAERTPVSHAAHPLGRARVSRGDHRAVPARGHDLCAVGPRGSADRFAEGISRARGARSGAIAGVVRSLF